MEKNLIFFKIHFYHVDGQIDTWLDQPLTQRIFRETVDPDTREVICPQIPQQVRDILKPWQDTKRKIIFNKTFSHLVTKTSKTPGPIEEIVTMFEKAEDKYASTLNELTSGIVFCFSCQDLCIVFNEQVKLLVLVDTQGVLCMR